MKTGFDEILDVYKQGFSSWQEASAFTVDRIFDFSEYLSNSDLQLATAKCLESLDGKFDYIPYLSKFNFICLNEIDYMKSIIDGYLESELCKDDPNSYPDFSQDEFIDQSIQLHQMMIYLIANASISLFNQLIEDKNYNSFVNVMLNKSLINSTVIKKQKDYGPNNVSKFGIWGLIVRMHDKIARLDNLLSSNKKGSNSVKDETIFDTMLDIVGYSVVSILWINGWFLLPMADD